MTGRCKAEYIVTGATGFLGGAVVRELISRGRSVTALALPEDPLLPLLPEVAFVRFGDVTDRASLIPAFEGAEGCRVIHCAGMVSVAAGQGEALGRINVQGTENIAGLCLVEYGAKRLVYVSSVHAIPERPMGEVITEECRVSPELVHGAYAKSKAAANKKVLLAAEKGLDAGIVYPSGIIGPGDRGMGSMTVMLRSFLRGRLPAGVCGGYDFVDVRDAAAGAVSCADSGRPGEGYILSGRYASIKELLTLAGRLSGRRAPGLFLPRRLAGLAAPIFERRSIRRGEKPFFTPYSISVLGSTGNFSHKKASEKKHLTSSAIRRVTCQIRYRIPCVGYPRCLYKKGGLSRPTLPYLSARHGVPFPFGTYYGRCGLMRIVKFLLARARAAALSVAPAVNMPVHDLYEALHKLPHGLSLVDEVILRTL